MNSYKRGIYRGDEISSMNQKHSTLAQRIAPETGQWLLASVDVSIVPWQSLTPGS
jgi:hypothetical protein